MLNLKRKGVGFRDVSTSKNSARERFRAVCNGHKGAAVDHCPCAPHSPADGFDSAGLSLDKSGQVIEVSGLLEFAQSMLRSLVDKNYKISEQHSSYFVDTLNRVINKKIISSVTSHGLSYPTPANLNYL